MIQSGDYVVVRIFEIHGFFLSLHVNTVLVGEMKLREVLELFVRQSIIWKIQKVPANGLCNFVLAITQDRKMWCLCEFCVKDVNLLIAFCFNLATHMLICFLLRLV